MMNWDRTLYWNLILVCLKQGIDEMYDDKRPIRTNPKGLPTSK